MTDVRALITEALQRELDEHDYEDDDEKRGQVAHHFADVLVSLPGIAIVELPERNAENGWRIGPHAIWFDHLGRIRQLGETILKDADTARALAAALLAAAAAAEQATS